MNERIENTQRAIVWLFLIGVAAGATYTISRLMSAVFRMAAMSHDDSFIAAFVVVGCAIIALMAPETWLTRLVFVALSASIIGGIATAFAPQTGLMSDNPLLWQRIGTLSMAFGIGSAPPLFWSMIKRAKVTEDDRKPSKIDRKSLSAVSERKRISARKPPKALSDGEAKPMSETAESIAVLNETAWEVNQHKGSLAAAGRKLGLSAPGVGDRLRRLYAIDPDKVEELTPEWLERNREKLEAELLED